MTQHGRRLGRLGGGEKKLVTVVWDWNLRRKRRRAISRNPCIILCVCPAEVCSVSRGRTVLRARSSA